MDRSKCAAQCPIVFWNSCRPPLPPTRIFFPSTAAFKPVARARLTDARHDDAAPVCGPRSFRAQPTDRRATRRAHHHFGAYPELPGLSVRPVVRLSRRPRRVKCAPGPSPLTISPGHLLLLGHHQLLREQCKRTQMQHFGTCPVPLFSNVRSAGCGQALSLSLVCRSVQCSLNRSCLKSSFLAHPSSPVQFQQLHCC